MAKPTSKLFRKRGNALPDEKSVKLAFEILDAVANFDPSINQAGALRNSIEKAESHCDYVFSEAKKRLKEERKKSKKDKS